MSEGRMGRRVRVKICGVTSKRDLMTVIDAGADAVGFVVDVAPSPRSLILEDAYELFKQVPVFMDAVAVTVPENLGSLREIYLRLRPNAIQIHGDRAPATRILRRTMPHTRLIKAVRPELDQEMDRALRDSKECDAVLLDSHVKGRHGGTGVVHDWEISREVKHRVSPIPVILAGGLTPENVEEAVRYVQPYAVDVSSGVECSPGVKDTKKVHEFIDRVKKVLT